MGRLGARDTRGKLSAHCRMHCQPLWATCCSGPLQPLPSLSCPGHAVSGTPAVWRPHLPRSTTRLTQRCWGGLETAPSKGFGPRDSHSTRSHSWEQVFEPQFVPLQTMLCTRRCPTHQGAPPAPKLGEATVSLRPQTNAGFFFLLALPQALNVTHVGAHHLGT